MSELLNTIKKDQLTARKNRESLKSTLLTTLIGEASPSGNQSVTDKDVEAKIRKFIKNAKESIDAKIERGQDTSDLQEEISILETYLPKQLSDDELETMVDEYISQHEISEVKQLGQVMGHFSKNYKGLFDGKALKNMVQSKLS